MTPMPASNPLNLRQAVRALILDDDDRVLLCRFEFPTRGIWALPGGGLEPGERYEDGLRREMTEELGVSDLEIGPHIWTRRHVIPMHSGHDGQVDRIHLVRTRHFVPEPTIGWDQMRAEFVHELRWWELDELTMTDPSEFAPTRLAELLATVLRDGPPSVPVETGV